MVFLISAVFSVLFVLICGRGLRKCPVPFYCGTIVLSALGAMTVWFGPTLPGFVTNWVLPVLTGGGLSSSLFVIVMITGALPGGSRTAKRLLSVRGELSILASILTLGHSAAYGKAYFLPLLRSPGALEANELFAALCSMGMLLLLLPLFLTSFKCIRRRMRQKTWKRLQHLAYGFYTLMYAHVMLLNLPRAMAGHRENALAVFLYSSVFLSYLICRVLKWAGASSLGRWQLVGAVCGVLIAAGLCAVLFRPAEGIVPEETAGTTEATTEPSAAPPVYRDGVYTGTGLGKYSEITVQVTVEDGRITEVSILSADEDLPYFQRALAVIPQILAANSPDVDGISGASLSCRGILDGVAVALEDAIQ